MDSHRDAVRFWRWVLFGVVVGAAVTVLDNMRWPGYLSFFVTVVRTAGGLGFFTFVTFALLLARQRRVGHR